MLPILVDYTDLLDRQFTEIKDAIQDLPPEAFDWSPGLEMNTLGVLVVHTAGSTRYWIGDIAGRDSSNRVRATEFETAGQDAARLIALLDEVQGHCQAVVARLTHDDLIAQHETGFSNLPTVSGMWGLTHALEHAAQHVGHIQITRQLWDQHQT